MPHLTELTRSFNGLELKFMRGNAAEVTEALKSGDVEIAIACGTSQNWERLDVWPLFSEGFSLVAHADHRMAGRNSVDLADLREEKLLVRPYCETYEQFLELTRNLGITGFHTHQIATDNDVLGLMAANVGVSIFPQSTRVDPTMRRVPINGLDISRTVNAYAVAGRQRSAVAATFLKMLRSADWPLMANGTDQSRSAAAA